MSTFKYNSACVAFAEGNINWLTAVVHCVLVDGSYSPSPNDQYLSAIPVGSRVVDTLVNTQGVRSNGVCYCTIPQFNALTWAAPVVGVVLYLYTGTDSTSQLLYYSSDGVGFPFSAQGFNYAVAFDQANGGFFQV